MHHTPTSAQDEYGRELTTPPQDRVAAVRPFWESLSDQHRAELLSVTLPELQERAKEIAVRQRKQAGGSPADSPDCFCLPVTRHVSPVQHAHGDMTAESCSQGYAEPARLCSGALWGGAAGCLHGRTSCPCTGSGDVRRLAPCISFPH